MIENFVFATGKQPKESDPRTLALSSYLTPSTPTPPASVDWGSKVPDWGMLGNDTVGDCAWAGQAHADMLWSSDASGKPVPITTQQVLAAYSAVTGYNPNDNGPNGNPTDKGTQLLAALRYWRKTGIDKQTIKAFVEVDPQNVDHVKLAIDLFGCAYVGVELPDAVLPTSPTSIPPWTVTPNGAPANQPDPSNGHCIIYSAYDADGPTVVTWGTTVPCSWGFHSAYCDEAYAMIAPSFFSKGMDPAGFNLTQLEDDLKAIKK